MTLDSDTQSRNQNHILTFGFLSSVYSGNHVTIQGCANYIYLCSKRTSNKQTCGVPNKNLLRAHEHFHNQNLHNPYNPLSSFAHQGNRCMLQHPNATWQFGGNAISVFFRILRALRTSFLIPLLLHYSIGLRFGVLLPLLTLSILYVLHILPTLCNYLTLLCYFMHTELSLSNKTFLLPIKKIKNKQAQPNTKEK